MEADRGTMRSLILAWTAAVIVFLYVPAVCLCSGIADRQPLFHLSHSPMGNGMVGQDTGLL